MASIPTYSSSLYEVDQDIHLAADSTRLTEGAMLVFEMLTKSYIDGFSVVELISELVFINKQIKD